MGSSVNSYVNFILNIEWNDVFVLVTVVMKGGEETHLQKSSHVHDKGGLLFLTESKAVLPTMVGNRIESSFVIPQ